MEIEGVEQEILLQPEAAVIGAVYSVNGKTGNVVLTTSDLENDSDYQTGAQVQEAISGKQDTLTAGDNIQISAENVISATDTTYSAGNGLNLNSENEFSINTTVVATQQNLATEVQNRENADNALQAQIDGISASSDVVDIVGTYADLQNYDTSKLKDNDIIKVLQDSTQNNATTYYRWSTSTNTFTLIGQEGPYYTKSAADAQFVPQTRTVNSKALSTNIILTARDVDALGTSDVVQTTGTSTSQVMSQNATTQALNTKLNITDYVVDDELKNSTNPVQNGVLYDLFGTMPTDFFTGNATTNQTGTSISFNNPVGISNIELQGDTTQQTYSGKNLFNGGTWRQVRTDSGFPTSAPAGETIIIDSGTNYIKFSAPDTYRGAESDYIPVTSGQTITLSFQAIKTCNRFWVSQYDTSKTRVSTLNNPSGGVGNTTFTTTEDGYIRVAFGNTTTGENFEFDKIQLELGSSASAFEPFVGSTSTKIVPSPNPEYPQDVQVVTGEQTVNVHGKNLFNGGVWRTASTGGGYPVPGTNAKIVSSDNNSIEFTCTSNYGGVESGFIPVTTGQTLTVSFNIAKAPNRFWITQYDSSKTRVGTLNVSSTSTVGTTTVSTTRDGYITVAFGNTTSGTNFRIYDIQLELGETATTYEPNKNYEIYLGTSNLFDSSTVTTGNINADGSINTAATNYATSDYIEIDPSLPIEKTATGSPRVKLYDSSKNLISTAQYNDIIDFNNAGSFEVPYTNAKYIRFTIYLTDYSLDSVLIRQPNIELCKMGTYQDYIYKSGDDWYVHKAVNKIVLTGAESWSEYATNVFYIPKLTEIRESVCDHFIFMPNVQTAGALNDKHYCWASPSNGYTPLFKDTDMASVADFTTWLGTHNTTVYYALTTATDTKITESTLISQLNALLNASVYAKTTYISNTATSPNLPAILDVDSFNGNYQGITAKLREN